MPETLPDMEPSTIKVFSLTVVLLMVVLSCTVMLEVWATSRALATGVLEEMVRGGGPLADTGVCGIKIDMDSAKESKIDTRILIERSLFTRIMPPVDYQQT